MDLIGKQVQILCELVTVKTECDRRYLSLGNREGRRMREDVKPGDLPSVRYKQTTSNWSVPHDPKGEILVGVVVYSDYSSEITDEFFI